jgi:preprotein translocase subunit SecF
MIWGVISGTYSSVFIASPIYYWLREHGHRFGFKKKSPVIVNR